MSKKTMTLKKHNKKHKNKRTYIKHKHKHKNKKRTYRKKRFKIINDESKTEKGIQLFIEPTKIHSQSILINQNQIQSGNMIPGLRNM
jgi:hypothetical protein